ncbi:hypothetical protein HOH45_03985 [bacterium]|jgi:hypothetical protein|nr:hypothetical protein [bacterium]
MKVDPLFSSIENESVPHSILYKINTTLDSRKEKVTIPFFQIPSFQKLAIGMTFILLIFSGGAFKMYSTHQIQMNELNTYIYETMVNYSMPEFDDTLGVQI